MMTEQVQVHGARNEIGAAVALCRSLSRARSWKQLVNGFVRQASVFPGVAAVRFRPAAGLCYVPAAYSTAEIEGSSLTCDAEAAANGKTWGVCSFRLKSAGFELTASFLGGQLGVACDRLHLRTRNEDLRQQLWYLTEEIAARKLFIGPVGSSRRNQASASEQVELVMRANARSNGTTLRSLAEIVICDPDRLAEICRAASAIGAVPVPHLGSHNEFLARVS